MNLFLGSYPTLTPNPAALTRNPPRVFLADAARAASSDGKDLVLVVGDVDDGGGARPRHAWAGSDGSDG
jgi:hypothetical protein